MEAIMNNEFPTIFQNTWDYICNNWTYGELSFFVLALWLSYVIGWWFPNLILSIIYKYSLFPSLKIQSEEKWPSGELLKKCIIFNIKETFISMPIFIVVYYYVWFQDKIFISLPSLSEFFLHIAILWFWADGYFYWSHRLMHHRIFYKRFHKKHHEFKTTIGIASNYVTFGESVFVNLISTYFGVFLVTPHVFTLFVFLLTRFEETCEEHSGYNFWFSPWRLLRRVEHHDYHHSHNKGAFGTFYFWDKFCGTDDHFNAFLEKNKQK
eukprot:TRINITY_DN47_c0_g1_i1.p1 TRINITY_DN47_c0_g1~~TRINITY_DN47_c0_g1_i1.p1  ORF type:complete len:266 (-),score=41.46 TRINITY_DN47_c0_g1_i1:167-964(-)